MQIGFHVPACFTAVFVQGVFSAANLMSVHGGESVAEQLSQLQHLQNAAIASYGDEATAATDEKSLAVAVDRYVEGVHARVAAAFTVVDSHREDLDVVRVLAFIIRTAKAGSDSEKAISLLLDRYADAPGVGDVCKQIFWFSDLPIAESLIRSALVRNPSFRDRALACHALSDYLRFQAKMIRRVKNNSEWAQHYRAATNAESLTHIVATKEPADLEREAEGLLERTIKEFGSVSFNGQLLSEIAKGELFNLRFLSIGKVAPDIVGADIDGQELKLSSFNGRVVVLLFSGEWCGNCIAMYPQLRLLADQMSGKRFSVLCVNTDEATDKLRKAMSAGEITWPCWCDGGTNGPISTEWGISAYPSVFVLDAQRVIRYRDVRDDALNTAVNVLMDEMLLAASKP